MSEPVKSIDPPAFDANDLRGIERIYWLQENVISGIPDSLGNSFPRWKFMSDKSVTIQCAAAVIEEIQDSLTLWNALRRRK